MNCFSLCCCDKKLILVLTNKIILEFFRKLTKLWKNKEGDKKSTAMQQKKSALFSFKNIQRKKQYFPSVSEIKWNCFHCYCENNRETFRGDQILSIEWNVIKEKYWKKLRKKRSTKNKISNVFKCFVCHVEECPGREKIKYMTKWLKRNNRVIWSFFVIFVLTATPAQPSNPVIIHKRRYRNKNRIKSSINFWKMNNSSQYVLVFPHIYFLQTIAISFERRTQYSNGKEIL